MIWQSIPGESSRTYSYVH